VLDPEPRERFGPDGVYVHRYIPEPTSVEGKAVHRPWRLDQDLDYPRPLESYRAEAIWLRDQSFPTGAPDGK
jgi:deoxyribodipyrimidine photo-lyase